MLSVQVYAPIITRSAAKRHLDSRPKRYSSLSTKLLHDHHVPAKYSTQAVWLTGTAGL